VIVLNEQFSKLALLLKPHKQRILDVVRTASMLKLDFTPSVTFHHAEAHL